MSMSKWLDYLLSLPMFPAQDTFAERLSIAKRLNLTQPSCFVITVSGTNGKGSVIALLEKACILAGFRVGAITSPHLIHFNERIRVDGEPVSNDLICEAFTEIKKQAGNTRLNYFVYAMLAGLYILKQKTLDVIIVEVGIGGRLDSANLIKNNLSIISNVDFDHRDLLGNTIEAIAKEKAGIIREKTPVVFGGENCPESLLQAVKEKSATLYCQGKDFSYNADGQSWCFHGAQGDFKGLPFSVIMLKNAATALQALQLFDKEKFSQALVIKALKEMRLSARCELRKGDRQVLLDVAHNPQAILHLAERIKALSMQNHSIVAVFGMHQDKDLELSLQPLLPLVDSWYLAELPLEKSLSKEQLRAAFERLGVSNYSCYSGGLGAYIAACDAVTKDDLVVVFGSFSLVGPILQDLQKGVN